MDSVSRYSPWTLIGHVFEPWKGKLYLVPAHQRRLDLSLFVDFLWSVRRTLKSLWIVLISGRVISLHPDECYNLWKQASSQVESSITLYVRDLPRDIEYCGLSSDPFEFVSVRQIPASNNAYSQILISGSLARSSAIPLNSAVESSRSQYFSLYTSVLSATPPTFGHLARIRKSTLSASMQCRYK